MRIHVYDCVQLSLMCLVSTCVCYTMLISLSLLSLFSCALVCLHTLLHVLYFCAHSLPTVPIEPHTFMYVHN